MGPGFLVYDLLYLLLATLLYGGAAWTAFEVGTFVALVVPWPFAIVPSIVVFLSTLILEVGALTALCPRLPEGRFRVMKDPAFFSWLVRSLLRRVMFPPGLKFVFFASNVLRFLALRALGARVAFTSSFSTDVDVLDPSLLEVGPGAIIGMRCIVAGHVMLGPSLILGKIKIGAGATLAVEVACAPDLEVGDGALVKGRTSFMPGVRIGAGAQVGPLAVLERGASVADGAKLGTSAYLAKGQHFG